MMINLQGQVFGKLTVISLVSTTPGANWNCQCSCGTQKVVASKSLRAKHEPARSCGCLKNRPRHKDIQGQRFGRLVAQRRIERSAGRSAVWECACDCGATHEVESRMLRNNMIQSCGCLKSVNMSRLFFKHGLTGTREMGVILAAKRRARLTGAGGTYSKLEIEQLFEAQKGLCVYCSEALTKSFHRDHITPICRGGSNWIENIQLLCAWCNHSKGKKTHAEYIAWLQLQ